MSLTVLVVDDYREVRELVSELFREQGCRVLEATNGHEAVEIVRTERVDLILMDLDMPVMDGYIAAWLITSDQRTRDIPLVAFSSDCSDKRKRRALEAGFIECLPKPVGITEIEKLLHLIK
jgi:CheY-like chemotaxis protein